METALESPQLLDELEKYSSVRRRVLGATLTTFAIGGPINLLLEPTSEQGLVDLLNVLHRESVPFRILGAGSNILIADEGVLGVVIKLGRNFRYSRSAGLKDGKQVLEIGAATSLMTLSRTAAEEGLSGLEFAAGIPATIGGAVFMNAGAHGSEMSAVLQDITFLRENRLEVVPVNSLPFGYRQSGLDSNSIVLSARLLLTAGDRQRILEQRSACLRERKERQPLTMPSAGSVFRNPSAETSAGKLIEEVGLKGSSYGGAQISLKHANWIVNPERKGTAADVQALIALCIEAVSGKVGVKLRPELVQW